MSKTSSHDRKLVLMIAEAALERRLVAEIEAVGATGYTISEVRGAGSSGERDGAWTPSQSIEVRVICPEEMADALTQRVVDRYGAHFSVIVFVAAGTVLRPERF